MKEEQSFQTINSNELLDILEDPEVQLIDVRPVDAYNGWRLEGEPRGGHITGARSLPAKWTEYIDWIEIVRSKHILPRHRLVLYGYDRTAAERVAKYFIRAGYENIRIYENYHTWSADQQLPIEKLARYAQLVSPGWLQQLLSTNTAPEYDNDRCVVCHAHYRNPGDYVQGHIPGAIEMDTLALESPETWNRRSPQEIRQALEAAGITHDTTVVLYGRFAFPDNNDPFPGSSAGHLGAMRCAFIMMYAGVRDVRILNGGLQSWLDAGYELSTETVEKQPVDDFGAPIPVHPELAVNLEEARHMIEATDKNLVCVRSRPEYVGEVSGYNYIEKKGRIPGAVFADCGSDAYHMENYRNLDHTIREYNEVASEWAKAGITPDKHNAFYCGTGWRGSEAFMNAWLMGWPRVSVFDGGWFEWSNNNLPFETGTPEDWSA